MRCSSVRVFVRPCSVNRLQSTSHENSYRGPTRGLIELNFLHIFLCKMGYVLAIFKFFLSALRSIKNYVNVARSSQYVSRLSDHTVIAQEKILDSFKRSGSTVILPALPA